MLQASGIEQVLGALGTTFRLTRLYPPSHPAVIEAMRHIADALAGVAGDGAVLEWKVAATGLHLQGQQLAPRNAQIASAADRSLAFERARVVVVRGNADQRADLSPVGAAQLVQLGVQLGDQRRAEHRPDAGNRSQLAIQVFEVVVGIDELADLLVERFDLLVQRRHDGIDRPDRTRAARCAAAVLLPCPGGRQLPATGDQRVEFGLVCRASLRQSRLGALRELRAQGRRVPEDVSVTGFDNVTLAQFCSPALTSVHIPRDQIGQTICDCLLPREHAPTDREFLIDPELVLRDSTAPPPPAHSTRGRIGRRRRRP